MPFLKRQRLKQDFLSLHDSEPLMGLANLLDLGLVFIVGLIITIFTAFHLQELFDQKSNLTILKKDSTGQLEFIEKKGKKIEKLKVSNQKVKGLGERLGTAYRLQDGTYVYVPEE